MDNAIPYQQLDPHRTTWHITFGTYGARLHGGDRPTVDRIHNNLGEEFIGHNENRQFAEQMEMRAGTVLLCEQARLFIEATIPAICLKGGWTYRICAAPADEDHVHTLLDAVPRVHGKDVRKWLKRWLSDALNAQFGKPSSGEWWAEGGSTKAVKDESYLNNAFAYIHRQRTTPPSEPGRIRPDELP